MPFKSENFVAALSMELLNLAKKTDLLNIANHYALTSVKPSTLKHEIKNILIQVLVLRKFSIHLLSLVFS